MGYDAIALLSNKEKLNAAFQQLGDSSTGKERREYLVDRCLMLCLVCKKEQLAELRQRYIVSYLGL